MNFLIIGGLLVIAVAAILGAVLLSIGEQRSERARTSAVVPTSRPTIPLADAAQQAQPTNSSRTLERPAPVRQGFPTSTDDTLRPGSRTQQLSALDGQFHELAVELRTMYQHARELEQRLRGLTEIVDRLEGAQSNQASIEEEARAHSPVDTSM